MGNINEKYQWAIWRVSEQLQLFEFQVKKYEGQKQCQTKTHCYGEISIFNDDYLKGEH